LNFRTKIPYVLAALFGAAYVLVATQFWSFYAIGNPVNDWLLVNLAMEGYEASYRVATYSHDLVVNTIIALPFAYLIARLNPKNGLAYLTVAVTVAILFNYWWIALDSKALVLMLRTWQFYVGFLVTVASLPLAYFGVTKFGFGTGAA